MLARSASRLVAHGSSRFGGIIWRDSGAFGGKADCRLSPGLMETPKIWRDSWRDSAPGSMWRESLAGSTSWPETPFGAPDELGGKAWRESPWGWRESPSFGGKDDSPPSMEVLSRHVSPGLFNLPSDGMGSATTEAPRRGRRASGGGAGLRIPLPEPKGVSTSRTQATRISGSESPVRDGMAPRACRQGEHGWGRRFIPGESNVARPRPMRRSQSARPGRSGGLGGQSCWLGG